VLHHNRSALGPGIARAWMVTAMMRSQRCRIHSMIGKDWIRREGGGTGGRSVARTGPALRFKGSISTAVPLRTGRCRPCLILEMNP
jgi:hypothetical protein